RRLVGRESAVPVGPEDLARPELGLDRRQQRLHRIAYAAQVCGAVCLEVGLRVIQLKAEEEPLCLLGPPLEVVAHGPAFSDNCRVAIADDLPLIPTATIGSYAAPGWYQIVREHVNRGELGETDLRELVEDASSVAISDQEPAGPTSSWASTTVSTACVSRRRTGGLDPTCTTRLRCMKLLGG